VRVPEQQKLGTTAGTQQARRNCLGKISSREEKNGERNPAHVHGPRRESEQKPKVALSGSRNQTTEKHEDGEKNSDRTKTCSRDKSRNEEHVRSEEKRNQKKEKQHHTRVDFLL
jgi:hypothetical protein